MTLPEILKIALEEFNNGNIFYFKTKGDGRVYQIEGFGNKYQGVCLDYKAGLHVGKHCHHDYKFSISDILDDYEICGEVK